MTDKYPKPYKIVLSEGFFSRFDELRRQNYSLKMIEIYNLVEDEYRALVGTSKFTGYDSFRNSRKFHQQKIKCQKP